MKGQGIIEYALILILAVVIIIVVVAVLSGVLGGNPCFSDKSSFQCKNARVQECMASEGYTKDQCVTLIGGGGGK